MDYPENPETPVTLTVTHEQLDAILQSVEWSLRFAELYEGGDKLEDVPLWPVIDRLYEEHAAERLPEDCRPGAPDNEWVPREHFDRETERVINLMAQRNWFRKQIFALCRALGWPKEKVEQYNDPEGVMDYMGLFRAVVAEIELDAEAAELEQDPRFRESLEQMKRGELGTWPSERETED